VAGFQSMQPVVGLTESGMPQVGNAPKPASSQETGAGSGQPSDHLNPVQFLGHLAEGGAEAGVGELGELAALAAV
jgi:hypothetical protein